MKLTFFGGAGSVTGANYLLESGGDKILIDCGLNQGSHYAERLNFEPFKYDPKDIKAAIITHAHIDHIGRLPKLFKGGFRGKIYSTGPTKDFAEYLLLDSEHILSREAAREKKPQLYSSSDVEKLMGLWECFDYHKPFSIGNFDIEFFDAGHILGSAIIRVSAEGKTVVFSGDLGNYPEPIIGETETIDKADYCLIESAYGNRVHNGEGRCQDMLEDIIEDAAKSNGVVLIPAFAMERTQVLLYNLNNLIENGRVPNIPVYIDSPLAIKLTNVYKKYERFFNKKAYNIIKSGDDILDFPMLHFTFTHSQSEKIKYVPPPKVIIAGSGMSHGGRIVRHEFNYLSDPKTTIIFVGYQVKGSLGRKILDGAEKVKIFGKEVDVRCRRVSISGYSAHADQPKLVNWLKPMRLSLKKVFVVQGEEEASSALARKIIDELAVSAIVPKMGDSVVLN